MMKHVKATPLADALVNILLIVSLVTVAFWIGVHAERSRHRCPERPVTAEDFKR